jgi:WD40-like Beta Propeller Repeat
MILGCAAVALVAATGTAGADVFGPISLVSASPLQQADYARDPAIAGDGRFVAFDGSFGGLTGVWRRDLQSGAVEPVAVGTPNTPEGSAALPSISEDGCYISFTTTASLVPSDTNHAPDVYVASLCPQDGEPLYTLASAITVEGTTQALSYSYGSSPSSEEVRYGSLAAGRTALSGNGRKVAFVTTAVSDLAGTDTPAMQVAVRDLETDETQLVSVRYPVTGAAEPVSAEANGETFGAVFGAGAAARVPSFAPPPPYGTAPAVGASISADGSTVAWMGVDIGEQSQLLSGETVAAEYAEPLWRRIDDGPLAPIRRVAGGSDPANPACAASGEAVLPPHEQQSLSDPCQGPFRTEGSSGVWTGGQDDLVPRLSADGYAVAFLANAPLVALGSDFELSGESGPSDLYVADMHEGLSRVAAVRALTELASGQLSSIEADAPILDLGISPDGSQVAFTTKRTEFPLGSPAYVSEPAAIAGMSELFDVDLQNDTLTRVTGGFEGGAGEHPHAAVAPGVDPYPLTEDGALSPSFSSDGNLIAFSSTASNLVYGDGNTPPNTGSTTFDGSDAFLVGRAVFSPTPTIDEASAPPANPSVTPGWRLDATTVSRRDGTVSLYVQVPGAGTLRAGADSAVLVKTTRKVSRASARARRSAPRARTITVRSVATRTVASGSAAPRLSGLVTITLRLSKPYSALASRAAGLSSTLELTFTSHGRPVLRTSIQVMFHRTIEARRKATPRKASKSQHAAKRSRR